MITNAHNELYHFTEFYKKYLPINTFPWIVLTLAAIAQFFAWFGGRYLFPKVNLYKRIFYLWCIAFIEFVILIPGIGASTEILGHSEAYLAIIFHAFQLVVFFILNKLTLKSEFNKKHMISFVLMFLSVMIVAKAK
ncbi:MAG: hypothetical protein EBX37_08295 [Alphaproteobacteria bacterium]|nr:hypothetical protein [Alphaproteobacteria bacterium]